MTPDELFAEVTRQLARAIAAELKIGGDSPPPEPDRLLTAAEAAARLGTSLGWLKRHASTLPFTKKLSGKIVRFSSRGIDRYVGRGGGR